MRVTPLKEQPPHGTRVVIYLAGGPEFGVAVNFPESEPRPYGTDGFVYVRYADATAWFRPDGSIASIEFEIGDPVEPVKDLGGKWIVREIGDAIRIERGNWQRFVAPGDLIPTAETPVRRAMPTEQDLAGRFARHDSEFEIEL